MHMFTPYYRIPYIYARSSPRIASDRPENRSIDVWGLFVYMYVYFVYLYIFTFFLYKVMPPIQIK